MEEMGLMRSRTGWLALLLTVAGTALGPTTGWGQEVPPASPVWPVPLYHDRADKGGLFVDGEFVFFHQTNPLEHQLIAIRGFFDSTGLITGHVGAFLGSGAAALYADDAGGPGSYTPGYRIGIGWRFEDSLSLELNYEHLEEVHYSAGATLQPFGNQNGVGLADTFISSFVFNFPNDFAGPARKVDAGPPFGVFGIWNGASIMTILFTQRYDEWNVNARIPIFQDDEIRCYGLVGPRYSHIWERFKWRTVSIDDAGNAGQDDVGLYSNVVSNNLWGIHFGCGTEWRCADTPAGTFSISLDLQAAALIDFVKEEAKYERGDFETSSKRSKRDYKLAPEVQGAVDIWWYPIEGVQIRVGYDVMAFFNTVAAQNPVSFNYSGLDPPWEHEFRLFDGFHAGIAFIF
jgi:hypothetical protein